LYFTQYSLLGNDEGQPVAAALVTVRIVAPPGTAPAPAAPTEQRSER